MIYLHSGAFVFNNAQKTAPEACRYSVKFNCTVFGVDYGVAPETKAPNGALNTYAALKYIYQNASEFCVDQDRIFLGGQSSGGNIVAATCIELAKR
jgi:acetyl esterase